MWVTCGLYLQRTYNPPETLSPPWFEGGWVIWLYVFGKEIEKGNHVTTEGPSVVIRAAFTLRVSRGYMPTNLALLGM